MSDTAAVEHRYWDNDEIAHMACIANGFASGSVYTFGATTLPLYAGGQPVPAQLPIVAGYRTCTGTEANIFQCPQCGNRVTQNNCQSWQGCTDGTTGQPICTDATHCCADQNAADTLSGCSHSIDQGVICYAQQEGSQLKADIVQCHGCAHGCALGGNGAQAVVFGCVDFWTAYCHYDATNGGGSYDAALSEFATCAEASGAPLGYCHGSLQSAAALSNQATCACNAPACQSNNQHIGFHIRIPFRNNMGGMYTFRMHADYGLGSFIGVDGAEHTPGNTWGHLQTDPVMLTAGDHEFESLGFEDCCDGHAELELHLPCDRANSAWRLVQAGDTQCLSCSGVPASSCTAQTSSAGTCGVTGGMTGASTAGCTGGAGSNPEAPPTGNQPHSRLSCTHTQNSNALGQATQQRCHQGRMEVYNSVARKWGTVCGHWIWDNDEAASIVCRAQGYAYGTIYTFGTSQTLPQLDVVAGYRVCTGQEQEIFQCPHPARLDGTLADPDCNYGCDSGCTHAIDQGAICYTTQSHSQLMPSIVPCQGCKYGCSSGGQVSGTGGIGNGNVAGGNTNGQEVIFGCIDYYTAQGHYETAAGGNNFNNALREFASMAEVEPEPTGYCHGSLTSAAVLRNEDVCVGGSREDIAFHIRIPFHVYVAGTYTFRMHADYGLGSFIGVDGAENTPGNTWGHVQSDPVSLTTGDHEFESLGFEDCCDGHSELEVHLPCDHEQSPWRLVSAGSTECLMCVSTSPVTPSNPFGPPPPPQGPFGPPPPPPPPPGVSVLPASCSSATDSANQCGSMGVGHGCISGSGATNDNINGAGVGVTTGDVAPTSAQNARISCAHPPTGQHNANPFQGGGGGAAGGSTGCKHGRLEVKNSQGQWGTVCGHWCAATPGRPVCALHF